MSAVLYGENVSELHARRLRDRLGARLCVFDGAREQLAAQGFPIAQKVLRRDLGRGAAPRESVEDSARQLRVRAEFRPDAPHGGVARKFPRSCAVFVCRRLISGLRAQRERADMFFAHARRDERVRYGGAALLRRADRCGVIRVRPLDGERQTHRVGLCVQFAVSRYVDRSFICHIHSPFGWTFYIAWGRIPCRRGGSRRPLP